VWRKPSTTPSTSPWPGITLLNPYNTFLSHRFSTPWHTDRCSAFTKCLVSPAVRFACWFYNQEGYVYLMDEDSALILVPDGLGSVHRLNRSRAYVGSDHTKDCLRIPHLWCMWTIPSLVDGIYGCFVSEATTLPLHDKNTPYWRRPSSLVKGEYGAGFHISYLKTIRNEDLLYVIAYNYMFMGYRRWRSG